MNKLKFEFSEKAMGEINTHLDAIESICHQGIMSDCERKTIQDVQGEIYALRQLIKDQGVIAHPNAA